MGVLVDLVNYGKSTSIEAEIDKSIRYDDYIVYIN
jgi:hypothetical protein